MKFSKISVISLLLISLMVVISGCGNATGTAEKDNTAAKAGQRQLYL
ncbi:hypothetical protein [Desulfoscipio gibsoniae]|uniref:ABC transporter substrate-binding protein n=1 Tax=Desulfoscipio gibsoniae DSM 7213 TaxID=767817 RepID=R4KEK5_9FIRM|nr:hypothetical protein [Desulfoscipio gibsoniae]AGL00102.1 hypothetical protein Desgi_0535 [Desulfoscipio gibsoniae DSM 7213]